MLAMRLRFTIISRVDGTVDLVVKFKHQKEYCHLNGVFDGKYEIVKFIA
jgi:hypothetical protein